jgi:hypothetical protein
MSPYSLASPSNIPLPRERQLFQLAACFCFGSYDDGDRGVVPLPLVQPSAELYPMRSRKDIASHAPFVPIQYLSDLSASLLGYYLGAQAVVSNIYGWERQRIVRITSPHVFRP